MTIWKIERNADTDDPRWLGQPIWSEVVVRAPTASLARIEAEKMQYRETGDIAPLGNETHPFQSGFADEKLYTVRRLSRAEAAGWHHDGPDAVLRAVGLAPPHRVSGA